MAYVEIKENFQFIRSELPQCPLDTIRLAFVAVCRDFCDHTRAMQFEAPAVTIVEDQSDYAIAVEVAHAGPPIVYELEPIAIEKMRVDDGSCFFKTVSWLDDNIANWRLREADDFRFFTQLKPGYFTFPCVPTIDGTDDGVRYRVSMRPKLTAEELDDAFLAEYLLALSDGTKARLMMEEGKTWYKPARGAQLELAYRHERGLTRIRVNKAYGNSTDRLSAPRFA